VRQDILITLCARSRAFAAQVIFGLPHGYEMMKQRQLKILNDRIEIFTEPSILLLAVLIGREHGCEGPGKCRGWLRNRWPGIGGAFQRRAVRRLAEALSPEGIPLLVEALAVPDRKAGELAEETLRSLRLREDRELIDVLCNLAIHDPSGSAAKICIATGKRPSDSEEACLFLVATGQLDAYFKKDAHLQGLRLAYEANRKDI